jgi:hypothetical protein
MDKTKSRGDIMTKTELLNDLSSKDWCESVSIPEVKLVLPNGTIWYAVNILDVSGHTGVARNIDFYVVHQGGPLENAYYKDAEPSETNNRQSALKQWMFSNVDTNPNNYKGVQLLWMSERWEMVIYSVLEGNPLEQVVYYVRKGQGSPTLINNFDVALLRSLTQI